MGCLDISVFYGIHVSLRKYFKKEASGYLPEAIFMERPDPTENVSFANANDTISITSNCVENVNT